MLKPEGSLFINLGDKYAGAPSGPRTPMPDGYNRDSWRDTFQSRQRRQFPARDKSLLGLPWRYAIGCTDQLGLILRAEIVWAKPNGLPESVTDRVRRAHEQVFHLVKQPRYYSAVDEIRESYSEALDAVHHRRKGIAQNTVHPSAEHTGTLRGRQADGGRRSAYENPLGKLPGSVWSIPSQPLLVPPELGVDHFACVDTDTEILTQRGWLRHDQLTAGDQVAGYDLDTNTARWTDCTTVSRYDYNGDLIAVESRDLSMRLTPNHRTIVQRMHTRAKRRSPVSVLRADELDRYHFIPRSVAWERTSDISGVYVGERNAAVMGWVAAEGWYQGNGVWLSQSLEVNAPHVAEIDQLIPDAARTERKRTYQGRPWTEVTWKLGLVGNLIQSEMPDKLLPWWLVTATEPERRAALDAFIAGDGHRRPDGRISIFQKHRHNLDVLQAAAVTLGYKATLRETGGRFVLYLTEGGRSVTLRGTSGVGSKVRREHYKGVVWCPTTGTGTFIARRNGSVFVTGNSFPMELPRRVVLGWSPSGVCTRCGQGRRPIVVPEYRPNPKGGYLAFRAADDHSTGQTNGRPTSMLRSSTITGYACACVAVEDDTRTGRGAIPRAAGAASSRSAQPPPLPPTRPAVVLDPFGGTGTTALVASVLGRHGITADLSMDYARLAQWRVNDPGERARAMCVPKPPKQADGQDTLFEVPG